VRIGAIQVWASCLRKLTAARNPTWAADLIDKLAKRCFGRVMLPTYAPGYVTGAALLVDDGLFANLQQVIPCPNASPSA